MLTKRAIAALGVIVLSLLLSFLTLPTAFADITCSRGERLDWNGKLRSLRANEFACFLVDVSADKRYLLVDIRPRSGKFYLYVGTSSQLSDRLHRAGIGAISRKQQFPYKNPTAGTYYVAVQAINAGDVEVIANVPELRTEAPQPAISDGVSQAPQSRGLPNNPQINTKDGIVTTSFTAACPGTITVTARWETRVPFVVALNGPLKPDFNQPYVSESGDMNKGTVKLTYTVTDDDIRAGKAWEVNLSHTKDAFGEGSIDVSAPNEPCPVVIKPVERADEIIGASSWGTGRLVVLTRGRDGSAVLNWRDGKGWKGWQSLGGQIRYGPAAGGQWGGQLDMFAIGSDGALWQRRNYKDAWQDWLSLGGSITGSPAAISRQDGKTLDVFARGSDNQLWVIQQRRGQWSAWQPLGGSFTSAPSAASLSDSRVDIFARGTDNALWHRSQQNGRWLEWDSLGGKISSAPASAVADGVLFVFARGLDNALWYRTYNGRWSEWASLGGSFTSAPAAATWSKNQLVVFARGSDGAVYQRTYSGGWSDWSSWGTLP